LEDQRNVGWSRCNSGDGTDQRVQFLMFMMTTKENPAIITPKILGVITKIAGAWSPRRHRRPGFVHPCTNPFNIKEKLCTLLSCYIYDFRMILRTGVLPSTEARS